MCWLHCQLPGCLFWDDVPAGLLLSKHLGEEKEEVWRFCLSSMSCFLVAVETVQLHLQALSVSKGKMLVFNLFLSKVVQAESRNRGTANMQLCVFKLPYCMCSTPKLKLLTTKTKPENKIPGSVPFLELKTRANPYKTTNKKPTPQKTP